MSPILDLQKRLVEVGRIRLGASTRNERGYKVPRKLGAWRLTSRDRVRLEAAAELYGGEVLPWDEGGEGHFVLDTKAADVPIMLMPGRGLSQWWELWGKPEGAGAKAPNRCLRRCDGRTEQLSDEPCLCPSEYDDRRDAATKGQACKPTTRLSVLLPEVPGVGNWRLESHGYYAAVELAGIAELLEEATARGLMLPARLRIEHRRGIRGEQSVAFPVPVIDLDVSVLQVWRPALDAGEPIEERKALEAGEPAPEPRRQYEPIEGGAAREGVTVRAGLEAVAREREPRRTARSAAPLGPGAAPPQPDSPPIEVGGEEGPQLDLGPAIAAPAPAPGRVRMLEAETPAPSGARRADPPPPEPEAEPEAAAEAEPPVAAEGEMATNPQRRRLWAIVHEREVPDAELRKILREETGQESTAQIPAAKYDAVIASIEAWKA